MQLGSLAPTDDEAGLLEEPRRDGPDSQLVVHHEDCSRARAEPFRRHVRHRWGPRKNVLGAGRWQ